MITMYQTGSALLAENRPLLDTQPDLSAFFRLDAPLLTHTDTVNYALRCECSGETLLALKVEPYNLLFFGSEKCIPELLAFLFDNGYEIKNYLCEAALGAVVHTTTVLALLTAEQAQNVEGFRVFTRPEGETSAQEAIQKSEAQRLLICSGDLAGTLDDLDYVGASPQLLRETSPIA